MVATLAGAFIAGILVATLACTIVVAFFAMVAYRYALMRSLKPAAPPPHAQATGGLAASYLEVRGKLQLETSYKEENTDFSLRALLRPEKPREYTTGHVLGSTLNIYAEESTAPLFTVNLEGAAVSHYPDDLVESERWLPSFPIRIEHKERDLVPGSRTIFAFTTTGVEKEDWFISLTHGASLGDKQFARISAEAARCRTTMGKLQRTLESPPLFGDPAQWFNAFLGRLYFDLDRHKGLTTYFTNKLNQKIRRKISRDGKPSFLGDVVVREVVVGDYLPMLSKASVKELLPDGTLTIDTDLFYAGGFSVTVETTAVVPGFNMHVPLILTVRVDRVEGQAQIRVKPPPSQCVWLGFHGMPDVQMTIEAVVGQRTITWSTVKGLIDRSIRDAIYEYFVLPNMDDYPMVSMSAPQGYGDLGEEVEQPNVEARLVEDDFVQLDIMPAEETEQNASSLRRRPISTL